MHNTETMLLFIESDEKSEDGMAFLLTNFRHQWATRDEQINLGEIEITYEIPFGLDSDAIREKAIKTLQDKQERIIADAYMAKQRLQIKIDKLLMLTHCKSDSELIVDNVVLLENDETPF